MNEEALAAMIRETLKKTSLGTNVVKTDVQSTKNADGTVTCTANPVTGPTYIDDGLANAIAVAVAKSVTLYLKTMVQVNPTAGTLF
jgi:hypothetical protein